MTVIGNTVVLVFEEAKIAHQDMLRKVSTKIKK